MSDREFDLNKEELDVLQADMDDESPQVLAAFVELALQEGALDAHLTPIYMKKNRPGVRIEVLCRPEDRERMIKLLLVETSTLGVKARRAERYSLDRRIETVEFDGHSVRVKLALLDGRILRATPEYEDCKSIARKTGKPLREIIFSIASGFSAGK